MSTRPILVAATFLLIETIVVADGKIALGQDRPASASGLTIARDGKPLARIVIPPNAPGTVKFAAKELSDYVFRVSGARLEYDNADPGKSPRIYLGECQQARAAGLDVKALKRDGFYRATVDGDIYILGRDPADPVVRSPQTELFREHGTLTGVYDFLEDVCGVRWFMAGKLGEVVPKRKVVTVPLGRIKEEPTFASRRFNHIDLFHYSYPDAKDLVTDAKERMLWALRLRWQTHEPVPGCHSATYLKFGERFGKEHPEWFALRSNGTRAIKTAYGPHLCWSQPGVAVQFSKDARAYLTGKSPRSCGLKSWYGGGYGNTFLVDPSDGYTACRCEQCQVALKRYPGQDYSEIMFATVAKVADSVKDLKGKYITTLAYGPKIPPPKTLTLPDNVRVKLCIVGPNMTMRPRTRDAELALVKQWSRRMKGELVLWTYENAAWYHGYLAGAVETMPHALADFLKSVRPHVTGIFFENEAQSDTSRALDSYLMMRLAWDTDQDVDALLDDYFSKFYGPAAKPIQQMYARFEENWKRILTFYPLPPGNPPRNKLVGTATQVDVWETIYDEAELKRIDGWLRKAESLTADQPDYSARIAILRKWIYKPMLSHRASFQENLGLTTVAKATCHRASAPPKKDGFLPAVDWHDAEWSRLNSVSNHGLNVIGRFKTLWRDGVLHLFAELDEPKLDRSATAASRKPDDSDLWKDNVLEIFLGASDKFNTSYQLIINDRGVLTDIAWRAGVPNYKWTSGVKARVKKRKASWNVEAALPLKSLGVTDPLAAESIRLNVCRERAIVGQPVELYSWSPAAGPGSWQDATRYGSIKFVKSAPPRYGPNLIQNGSFEQPGQRGEPFAGWHVPKQYRSVVHRDEKTRWDGKAALRYESAKSDQQYYSGSTYFYFRDVKPDTAYRFRCRVKSQKAQVKTSGLFGVYVDFYVPVVHTFNPNPGLTGTSDWRTIEFNATTAKEFKKDAKGYIILTFHEASGKAWFDDVSFREVLKE